MCGSAREQNKKVLDLFFLRLRSKVDGEVRVTLQYVDR